MSETEADDPPGAGAPDPDPVGVVPGPPPSFDTLYRDAYPGLVRLALLMMGDDRVAEELVQDAFVTVHDRWARLDNPRAFVRTCVVNRCRDALRRRQRAERFLRRRPSADVTTGDHEHVDDLLAVLNARQRAVIVLRFYEDLTIDEIAAVLGTPAGTVKSLLHRALARLRDEDIQW